MRKSGGKSPKRRTSDILGITPERLSHGPVERLERPIADTDGGIGRPSRAIDILAALYRRGAITGQMLDAGEAFRCWFFLAHLDPLKSSDLTRTPSGIRPSDSSAPVENARAASRKPSPRSAALLLRPAPVYGMSSGLNAR